MKIFKRSGKEKNGLRLGVSNEEKPTLQRFPKGCSDSSRRLIVWPAAIGGSDEEVKTKSKNPIGIGIRAAFLSGIIPIIFVFSGCKFFQNKKPENLRTLKNSDTTFCTFSRNRSISPPDSTIPFVKLINGLRTTFHFGHYTSVGSENSTRAYYFEVDSSKAEFAFDSSNFEKIKLYSEEISMLPVGPKILGNGKIEGTKTSDTTWVLREWVSTDYKELARRNSYKNLKSKQKFTDGFERLCAEEKWPPVFEFEGRKETNK